MYRAGVMRLVQNGMLLPANVVLTG
jgi:hypothetical protein